MVVMGSSCRDAEDCDAGLRPPRSSDSEDGRLRLPRQSCRTTTSPTVESCRTKHSIVPHHIFWKRRLDFAFSSIFCRSLSIAAMRKCSIELRIGGRKTETFPKEDRWGAPVPRRVGDGRYVSKPSFFSLSPRGDLRDIPGRRTRTSWTSSQTILIRVPRRLLIIC